MTAEELRRKLRDLITRLPDQHMPSLWTALEPLTVLAGSSQEQAPTEERPQA
jgi:hypothetical protein